MTAVELDERTDLCSPVTLTPVSSSNPRRTPQSGLKKPPSNGIVIDRRKDRGMITGNLLGKQSWAIVTVELTVQIQYAEAELPRIPAIRCGASQPVNEAFVSVLAKTRQEPED